MSQAHYQRNATTVTPRPPLYGERTTKARRSAMREQKLRFIQYVIHFRRRCGLYYKLHGSARPISMKSDVIRKRSRHDARRGNNTSETPSASPGVSRRPSPARDPSPTLAPDSTTQLSYDYHEEMEYRSAQSELLGALGPDNNQSNLYSSSYQFHFPGPYHPDYLLQHYSLPSEPLPFSNMDSSTSSSNSEIDLSMSPRSPKRRRMSTDSASEPPSSAASYSSFDNYSAALSVTSNSA